ncbi:hypothetical protein D3C72_1664290 [compost metagenome]
MRLAPNREMTPPAAMPPTMPRMENTAVRVPMDARSNPMSWRSRGAAMITLPTCKAATTPAPTIASTAPQCVRSAPSRAGMPSTFRIPILAFSTMPASCAPRPIPVSDILLTNLIEYLDQPAR